MGYTADFTEYSERKTARDIDLDDTVFAISDEPGELHGWYIGNAADAIRYVKIFDEKAADVVLGTTTPKLTLLIPGTTGETGAAANFIERKGIHFANGISAVAVTGVADADTTGAGENEVVANFIYSDQSIG
jgi:hypothetical protein